MKYILILLMLVSTVCYGQKKDNISKDAGYDHNYLDRLKIINKWKYFPFVGEPNGYKDTGRIIQNYYIIDTVTDTLVLPTNDSLIGWKSLHENGIKQSAFFSFGIWHLVTNDGSLYDNVIHGDLQFIESQKSIEYNKALQRRNPILIITAKCKSL